MSTFAADVKTALAVADPMTDYLLPPAGALAYAAITTAAALASTTGHDTLLLQGDRDRQMHGNENTVISQNRSHQVGGNQQKQIAGNKNENIVGNFIHQTIGNLHRTIIGATNDLYTAEHAIAHKANQLLHEPVTFFHAVNTTSNQGEEYAQKYGNYDSEVGTYFNVVGMNTDLKGVNLGFSLLEAVGTGPSVAKHAAKVQEAELNARFHAVQTQIGAIEPEIYITNIHAVAITTIIGIALGENQVI